MIGIQLLYVFILIKFCSAVPCQLGPNNCPDVCVLDDVKCTTPGFAGVYKMLAVGIKGLVPPLDPLYIPTMKDKKKPMKYDFGEVELKGLSRCNITFVSLNVTEEVYAHRLYCPKLEFKYIILQKPDESDYRQTVTGIATDYDIQNCGMYRIFVAEKDHIPHFRVSDIQTKVDLKGSLTFDIKQDIDHRKKTDQSWHKILHEKILHNLELIVTKAMKQLEENSNVFSAAYPMGKVLPASVSSH